GDRPKSGGCPDQGTGPEPSRIAARPQEKGSQGSEPGVPGLVCMGVQSDYWRGAAHDEAMQDEHAFIWRAMLETMDINLAGARVLDAGCNRGGFLRLLVDDAGISAGFGYDPASGAIGDARRLAGDRPLTFEAAD